MDNREIDREIAVKIFNWKTWHFKNPSRTPGVTAFEYDTLVPPEYDGSDLQHLNMIIPHYSTDIAAAWQVVEKLRERYLFTLSTLGDFYYAKLADEHGENEVRSGYVESAPLAICLAALKVVAAPYNASSGKLAQQA